MMTQISRDRGKERCRSRRQIYAVVASRIVHQTIDRTEPFDDLGYGGPAGIVVIQIHPDRVANIAQDLLERLRYGVSVEYHGDGAFTGQNRDGRGADPAGASRDEHDLCRQTEVHANPPQTNPLMSPMAISFICATCLRKAPLLFIFL